MARHFLFKTVEVKYSVYVDRKLPKKFPRGKKKWEYHLKETVSYLGYQLYAELYKTNANWGRFCEKDKVYIAIRNIRILKSKQTSYNYDPYKQQNLKPGILDSDDHIFDLIPRPMPEEEGIGE